MRREQSKIQVVMLPPEGHRANQTKLLQAVMQGENGKLPVDEPRNRSADVYK